MARNHAEIALSSASLTDVYTAGGAEQFLNLRIVAATTSTAQIFKVFLHDGTTSHLLGTITVTALTVSSTQPPFQANFGVSEIYMDTGDKIQVQSSNTEAFSVFCTTRDV